MNHVSCVWCKLLICQRKNKARKGRWQSGGCFFYVTCYSVEVALLQNRASPEGVGSKTVSMVLASGVPCPLVLSCTVLQSISPLEAFLLSWPAMHKPYLVADFWESSVVLGRGCLGLWMPFSVIGRTRGRPHMFLAAKVLIYLFRVFFFFLLTRGRG